MDPAPLSSSRREFLTTLGLSAVTSLTAEPAVAVSPDAPRGLRPTGSDLGNLWPEVGRRITEITVANQVLAALLPG